MLWGEFRSEYEVQIRQTARSLLRRWKVPAAVSAEDLEQELWLGAWRAWDRWVPTRGSMSRPAYAFCSGRLSATRWLHEQRNACRRGGSAPGRWPAPESSLGEVQVPGSLLELVGGEACAAEPGQEVAAVLEEAVRRTLEACRTPAERRALKVLVSAGFDRREARQSGAASAAVRVVWQRLEEEVLG